MRVRDALLRGTDAGGDAREMLISGWMRGESVPVPFLSISEIGLELLESMGDQIAASKRKVGDGFGTSFGASL
jgi:hypothetical protein